jgi:hypothetical protein
MACEWVCCKKPLGVVDHAQRGTATRWIKQLGDGVAWVAQTDDAANFQQLGQRRAQGVDAHEHRFTSRPSVADVGGVVNDGQAEVMKHIGRGHPARVFGHAMHQHRHASLGQQQCQQGGQVGQLASTVVRRKQHHRRVGVQRVGDGHTALLRRFQKTRQLDRGFAFDTHGNAEGTDL